MDLITETVAAAGGLSFLFYCSAAVDAETTVVADATITADAAVTTTADVDADAVTTVVAFANKDTYFC